LQQRSGHEASSYSMVVRLEVDFFWNHGGGREMKGEVEQQLRGNDMGSTSFVVSSAVMSSAAGPQKPVERPPSPTVSAFIHLQLNLRPFF
jgi:hypothetical protein